MKAIAPQYITRLFSQYLNYKAAELEYKNPLLNGLQMFCMMSDNIDISKNDIATQLIMPVLSGIGTVIDDILIQNGIFSKHHFSDLSSAFNMGRVISNFEFDKVHSSLIVGGLLGVKYVQEYLSGDKGLIHTQRDLQLKVNKNMNQLEYVTNGKINAKAAIFSQVIINTITDGICNYIGGNLASSKGIIELGTNLGIANCFSESGANEIKKKNNIILQSPHGLLKISSSEDHSNTLNNIDDISNDCINILQSTLLLNSALTNMNSMFTKSPLLFHIMSFRSLSGILYNQSNQVQLHQTLKELTSYAAKFKTSLIHHPRTVIERDGLSYYSNKDDELQAKISAIQNEIQEKDAQKLMTFFVGCIESGLESGLLLFNDLKEKNMQLQDILNNQQIIIEHSLQFGNSTTFLANIMDLSKTESLTPNLNRLTELYKFLETVKNTSYVNYYSHDSNGVHLKDIDININGINKLHIQNMCLENGKWYLLSGKSGCGKSTFMSTLRGLPNFTDAIIIKGQVFYPKINDNPQIYMLTQANNFPYMTTMMEAILYPMITTDLERASYKNLVEELMLKMEGLTRDSKVGKEYLENGLLSRLFENINDITSETSGGQQKKMSITGMIVRIMKETGMLDIYNEKIQNGYSHDVAMKYAKDSVGSVLVLIDETFNGLDSGISSGSFVNSSKGLVLKTLKESLPTKAIVVSVEHQPQIDQYNVHIQFNGDGSYTSSDQTVVSSPVNYDEFQPFESLELINT